MSQSDWIAAETNAIVARGNTERTGEIPVVLDRTLKADKKKDYNDQTSQMFMNGNGPLVAVGGIAVAIFAFCVFMALVL